MTTEEKIDKVVSDIGEIKVLLKGYNGQEGLCKQVENQGRHIQKLWVVIAILGASFGGGGAAIIRAILGS